mmetsp:Transcript_11382/g.22255  ORF Transcript_11382/g.22255 Transcript_11382/m.22255 type:complete len:303 (-) Transcript_11382:389-1297(-)
MPRSGSAQHVDSGGQHGELSNGSIVAFAKQIWSPRQHPSAGELSQGLALTGVAVQQASPSSAWPWLWPWSWPWSWPWPSSILLVSSLGLLQHPSLQEGSLFASLTGCATGTATEMLSWLLLPQHLSLQDASGVTAGRILASFFLPQQPFEQLLLVSEVSAATASARGSSWLEEGSSPSAAETLPAVATAGVSPSCAFEDLFPQHPFEQGFFFVALSPSAAPFVRPPSLFPSCGVARFSCTGSSGCSSKRSALSMMLIEFVLTPLGLYPPGCPPLRFDSCCSQVLLHATAPSLACSLRRNDSF